MGYLRHPAIRATVSAAERRVTTAVDHVVVIGERMARAMEDKGVDRSRISVIPNWSPVEAESIVEREGHPLLCGLGLDRKFVVQYSGNMGVVHDMGPIIDAAAQLRDDMGIHWLFIGDGKRRLELEQGLQARGVSNATFLPYQPLDQLGHTLRACDVALISLRPDMEGLVVPSKLYACLQAGRPILFVGSPSGEVATVLSQEACGTTATTGDELSAAILALAQDPAKARAMGDKARRAYLERYSRTQRISNFAQLLHELSSGRLS